MAGTRVKALFKPCIMCMHDVILCRIAHPRQGTLILPGLYHMACDKGAAISQITRQASDVLQCLACLPQGD